MVVATLVAVAMVYAISFSRVGQPRSTRGTPSDTISLSTGGAKLLVREGAFVYKGQIVAERDSSRYQADLEKAESELKQIQTQTQNVIMPMPELSGVMPRQIEIPRISRPKPETAPPVVNKPEPKPSDAPNKAIQKQADARAALDMATKNLAESTASLAAAQESRDALRPKVGTAQVVAIQASKKAEGAQELLDAGVISRKRAEELEGEKAAALKALDDLNSQVAAAEESIASAKTRLEAAQANLDKATASLHAADDALTRAANLAPQPKPESPSVKPTAKPKTDIVVSRPMPMSVRLEPLPATPLKVFVDEKAMQTSQIRMAELDKQISDLKAKIEACQIRAPISGRIQISANSEIEIRPL